MELPVSQTGNEEQRDEKNLICSTRLIVTRSLLLFPQYRLYLSEFSFVDVTLKLHFLEVCHRICWVRVGFTGRRA